MYATRALLISAILLTAPPLKADPPEKEAFGNASLAPATATVYVHVEGAAKIRRELATRPVARFVETLLEDGHFERAWGNLARSVKLDEDELFDLWLGGEFTFIKRSGARGSDWAIVTEVASMRGRAAVQRLNPRHLAPRWTIPLAEIPEHALRIAAVDERRYLIGPAGEGRLFESVLKRLAKRAADEPMLLDDPAFAEARRLGRGDVELFVRHDLSIGGGWSALVAELDAPSVHLRHTARFEVSPLQRPVTGLAIDVAPLTSLQQRSFFSIIEPTDVRGGPAEAFLEATLGVPLMSGDMSKNADDSRILTLGEIEANAGGGDAAGADQPFEPNTFLPAGAVAIKVRDARWAEEELDAHLTEVARAIDRLGQGAFELHIPPARHFVRGRPRQIDLQPALRHFAGDMPLARAVTLNWTVASGPHGDFYVMATHPQHLVDTVEALESAVAVRGAAGKWTQCGALDGRRLSIHLAGHTQGKNVFGGEEGETLDEFRHTMRLLSELAEGVKECQWRVRRPSAQQLEVEVDVVLSPSESARGASSEDEWSPRGRCRGRKSSPRH